MLFSAVGRIAFSDITAACDFTLNFAPGDVGGLWLVTIMPTAGGAVTLTAAAFADPSDTSPETARPPSTWPAPRPPRL